MTASWNFTISSSRTVVRQTLALGRYLPPCNIVSVLNLIADAGNLTAIGAWSRMSLILSGDIETNPGPAPSERPPPSVSAAWGEYDYCPFTDKSVRYVAKIYANRPIIFSLRLNL